MIHVVPKLTWFVFRKNMTISAVNFIEKYANKENLEQLGWVSVLEFDSIGLKTLCQITTLAEEKGFGHPVKDAWFTTPIALKSQDVLVINADSLKSIKQWRTRKDLNIVFREFPLKGCLRNIPNIKRKPELKRAQACNLHLEGLMDYTLPWEKQLISTDVIFVIGQPFIEGHLEEKGDDSLSLTAVGKNLFLIAVRCAYSKALFECFPSVENFMRRAMEGPRKSEKEHVKVSMSEAGIALAQTEFCCVTVLNISAGPSLVTNW